MNERQSIGSGMGVGSLEDLVGFAAGSRSTDGPHSRTPPFESGSQTT